MLNLFREFRSNESGATAIEYALIGGLISISIIIGATQLGDTLANSYKGTADAVKEVNDRD